MTTDWETRYQQGETPWDKGAPSPGLQDFLTLHPLLIGRVLVPGCGFGHDVRLLAGAAPEVLGLDLAPSAIEGARAFPRVGGESYAVGDFFQLPESYRGAFDWVWEHTCFCAIDPAMRSAYVESAAQALKSGGNFLAVFYLDPGQGHPSDGPPFGVSKAELDALFEVRFELVAEWLPARAYIGREGREWMRWLRRR